MRKAIYYISMLFMFTTLIAGIDNYFGPEIRTFSIVVFLAWTVQVLTRNWQEIIEFLKVLYGMDKK